MESLNINLVIETNQRGTYATTKVVFQKLRERGHEVRLWTTFPSEFNVLPRPPSFKPFGYDVAVNLPTYARKVLKVINPPKDSIVHSMNAMHELAYLAHGQGVKSAIAVHYAWPICYFNAYSYNACDCTSSVLEAAKCIYSRRRGPRKAFALGEALYWKLKRSWIRRNLMGSSAILAISKFTKELLVKAGYEEAKIRVVYISALMPYNIEYSPYEPSDAFTFAYLSYPDEGKGIFQLIKAFALAIKANPKLRLKIYGGLTNPDVVRLVGELGIRDKVELTGWAPFENFVSSLEDLLRDVDVVVVPSMVFETWARVVTEAMLSGRPVIVTKGNGGLVEQVEDKVTGFHVNVYKVEEFARSLIEISSISREELRNMGLRARETALAKWNQERIVDSLEHFYKELL
ncbi:putative glycosyltransferase (group 1) [Acidilobus saccharovorans 345-15]|uniref:Putative glycosyltransferase (Group 1) n=1 Tax=Acidilobus saccharovorans (strain DSM 16705 / JCM 18335 / VKM B-2471 / 345-15) TaxID=666510 RepID=D9Q188_ACIS3|nr:glycosyltransferase family 4 protein [Acidilobus saccharovorans]ADL19076.1 putative glycosyltransferase (group 1) [Acidilobus saccharovorans 345-15]